MEHILNIWPNLKALADDIGSPYQTVAAWKQRGRIPADHDFALIAAASRRGEVLTLETLANARVRATAQNKADAA